MNEVARQFPDETIVCVGGGPSVTQADVDYCRGRARVIAIKDAIRLAPWADVLYCGEENWWSHYGPTLEFQGLRYSVNPTADQWSIVLGISGTNGLEVNDRTSLRTGKQSGYQAINVAVHLGAKRILLLGYDMKPSSGKDHWFGSHPYHKDPRKRKPAPYHHAKLFDDLIEPLHSIGVEIFNCSPDTILTCFPRQQLQEILQ